MEKGVDFVGVGVAAVIFDDKNRVLLAKRGKKARNQWGRWECPGGAVELGEELEDAIVREIKEELALKIKVIGKLEPYADILKEEKQHWILVPFLCKLVSGTPKILEPEKCEDIGWFSLKEMGKMDLSQSCRKIYEQLVGR